MRQVPSNSCEDERLARLRDKLPTTTRQLRRESPECRTAKCDHRKLHRETQTRLPNPEAAALVAQQGKRIDPDHHSVSYIDIRMELRESAAPCKQLEVAPPGLRNCGRLVSVGFRRPNAAVPYRQSAFDQTQHLSNSETWDLADGSARGL